MWLRFSNSFPILIFSSNFPWFITFLSCRYQSWKSLKLYLSKQFTQHLILEVRRILVMSLNSMKSKLPFEDKEVNQETKMERKRKFNRDVSGYWIQFLGVSFVILLNPYDNLDNLWWYGRSIWYLVIYIRRINPIFLFVEFTSLYRFLFSIFTTLSKFWYQHNHTKYTWKGDEKCKHEIL